MPFALLLLFAIAAPIDRPHAAVLTQTAATMLATSQTGSGACQETPSAQSAWKDMLQAADAKLCTTTILPE
jgi:hypothetical protein